MKSNQMFKYPSIDQFRNIAYNVSANELNQIIEFERTVKIHGANASIVYDLWENDPSKKIYAQSRNRVLTVKQDSMGFAKYVEDNRQELIDNIQEFVSDVALDCAWDNESHLVVYGEWCGEGIQKGVAVNKCPKMFVVFDSRLIYNYDIAHGLSRFVGVNPYWDEEEPVHTLPVHLSNHTINLYNIHEFGSALVEVDFTNPLKAQESLLEDVKAIEVQCPVGAYFGHQGIGEGYVYTSTRGRYKFKVKGEAHSVSKTKFITEHESNELAIFKIVAEGVTTENRMLQGIEYLNEMQIDILQPSSMGDFIKWTVADVIKEEGDLITETGGNLKVFVKQVAKIAREWFIEYTLTIRRDNAEPTIEEGLF